MEKFLLVGVVVLFCISKFFQCLVFNVHNVLFYGIKDIVKLIIFRKKEFKLYGIDMYIGMFGKGKTLSMVHKAQQIYKFFGDDVTFLSNIKLNSIPYIPLENFEQLIDLENKDKLGYVVIIDEVSSVLSHRNYSNFPIELIGLLTQQRKKKIYIMATAQRFFMVDKIFRSITTNIIDCNKFWRFEHCKVFDAWEFENSGIVKPRRLNHSYWFIKDKDFSAYDTSEMIDKNKSQDFISNEESIKRKCLENTVINFKQESGKRKKA